MIKLCSSLFALAWLFWGTSVGGAEAAQTVDSGMEWPLHGRTHANDMYSPLQQIDASNIQRLGVAWYVDFEARSLRGVEGTPIVADGVIYATGPWSKVLAVDA